MTRIFVCFAAAVFVSQLSASVGSSGGPGSGCSAGMRWGSGTMVGGPEAMRIRGGMADQMAEIRAMRARQYEEAKKGEQDEAAKQAAQEAAFEGAQKAWVMVTDKIKPATIQTKAKSPMSPGDARNFYQDSGVTLLRNRQTGAVVELLHASEGWVQLSAREGAPLQLLSSAGDLAPSHRWYAEGLLEQIKDKPLHAHSVPSDGAACGPWKLEVVGRRMVVSHREDVHKQLHLTEDGVVVLNHLWEEALLLRSSGAVDRSPLAEAEAHLTTV